MPSAPMSISRSVRSVTTNHLAGIPPPSPRCTPCRGGGGLVDTPGFRDFGLVDISSREIAAYFPGFEALEEYGCRFNNCRHRQEPGCAVAGLVEAGGLSAERYQTYLAVL